LQNAGFKWCNLKLWRPDVLLTFFELLGNNADDGSYTVFTASCGPALSRCSCIGPRPMVFK